VRWTALTLALFCLPWSSASAAPVYPKLRSWVADPAGVLTPAEEGELQQIAGQLDTKGVAQLAIAIVRPDDLGDLSRPEYAVELFRRWKLGHSRRASDGLLLLFVAGPPGERGLKVEVGYGLEGVLPDGKVGALLDETAGALLRKGELGAAAIALASSLARALEGGAVAGTEPGRWLSPGTAVMLAVSPLLAALALLLVFVNAYLRRRVPGREVTALVALLLLLCIPGFVGLVAADARWLIWALFLTLGVAVLDIGLYLELQESRCPRDGRWLSRRISWTSLVVEKSCGCGYRALFSFAPGAGRTASGGRTSASSVGGVKGGGGGESGGGGADRQY
jgi:uncharacterized membrane protein YgcG